jgi:hypothetical protein
MEVVTFEGMKYETPGVCIYEIGDGKIKQHTVLYDRLSVAKQAVKGAVSKRVINSVLNTIRALCSNGRKRGKLFSGPVVWEVLSCRIQQRLSAE